MARNKADAFFAKHRDETHSAAYEAGFDVWHTGGGCLAMRKDAGDSYFLITDDSPGVEGNPDEQIWIVGRYRDDDAHTWILVDEGVTLREAVQLHDRLPAPTQEEQIVARWDDLATATPPGP